MPPFNHWNLTFSMKLDFYFLCLVLNYNLPLSIGLVYHSTLCTFLFLSSIDIFIFLHLRFQIICWTLLFFYLLDFSIFLLLRLSYIFSSRTFLYLYFRSRSNFGFLPNFHLEKLSLKNTLFNFR